MHRCLFLTIKLATFRVPRTRSVRASRRATLHRLLRRRSRGVTRIAPFIRRRLDGTNYSGPRSVPIVPFRAFKTGSSCKVFIPVRRLDALLGRETREHVRALRSTAHFGRGLEKGFFLRLICKRLPGSGSFFRGITTLGRFMRRELRCHVGGMVNALRRRTTRCGGGSDCGGGEFSNGLSGTAAIVTIKAVIMYTVELCLLSGRR